MDMDDVWTFVMIGMDVGAKTFRKSLVVMDEVVLLDVTFRGLSIFKNDQGWYK